MDKIKFDIEKLAMLRLNSKNFIIIYNKRDNYMYHPNYLAIIYNKIFLEAIIFTIQADKYIAYNIILLILTIITIKAVCVKPFCHQVIIFFILSAVIISVFIPLYV